MDVRLITPLIITFNEEPNVARTLNKLWWADRIIVIDSGSKDATLSILQRYRAVEVFRRELDDFAAQWNFGLAKVTTPWVLALDADYELSDDLITELHNIAPMDHISGYNVGFIYRSCGRPLRGALYPPHTVLFRKLSGTYRNVGHTQRLTVDGEIDRLSGSIFHDDRKPIDRWFSSQQRYARLEVDYLLSRTKSELRQNDRIRLFAWPAPILVFWYTLLVNGCVLEGWPGWLYVLQRTLAEIMIAVEIIDRKLKASPTEKPTHHDHEGR
jgi:glycosyltransferase involved in cell wall biosynthesis